MKGRNDMNNTTTPRYNHTPRIELPSQPPRTPSTQFAILQTQRQRGNIVQMHHHNTQPPCHTTRYRPQFQPVLPPLQKKRQSREGNLARHVRVKQRKTAPTTRRKMNSSDEEGKGKGGRKNKHRFDCRYRHGTYLCIPSRPKLYLLELDREI